MTRGTADRHRCGSAAAPHLPADQERQPRPGFSDARSDCAPGIAAERRGSQPGGPDGSGWSAPALRLAAGARSRPSPRTAGARTRGRGTRRKRRLPRRGRDATPHRYAGREAPADRGVHVGQRGAPELDDLPRVPGAAPERRSWRKADDPCTGSGARPDAIRPGARAGGYAGR